jgi:uncharacterized protein YraI
MPTSAYRGDATRAPTPSTLPLNMTRNNRRDRCFAGGERTFTISALQLHEASMAKKRTVRRGLPREWVVILLLAVPVSVFAQSAQTFRAVNVRAGPDHVFPLVTWLPQRADVQVAGCTEGWRWCDIVSGRIHGWVDGASLSGAFRNARIPIVKFSVESYWDANYRNRPWYASRAEWAKWGTPSFHPPPSH